MNLVFIRAWRLLIGRRTSMTLDDLLMTRTRSYLGNGHIGRKLRRGHIAVRHRLKLVQLYLWRPLSMYVFYLISGSRRRLDRTRLLDHRYVVTLTTIVGICRWGRLIVTFMTMIRSILRLCTISCRWRRMLIRLDRTKLIITRGTLRVTWCRVNPWT